MLRNRLNSIRKLILAHVLWQQALACVTGLLLSSLFLGIALVLRLETGRPIFVRQRRLQLSGAATSVTLFQIRRLNGTIGPWGALLRDTGLMQLPMLLDMIAGRLPVRGPWLAVSNKRQPVIVPSPAWSRSPLARLRKERYRSAA